MDPETFNRLLQQAEDIGATRQQLRSLRESTLATPPPLKADLVPAFEHQRKLELAELDELEAELQTALYRLRMPSRPSVWVRARRWLGVRPSGGMAELAK